MTIPCAWAGCTRPRLSKDEHCRRHQDILAERIAAARARRRKNAEDGLVHRLDDRAEYEPRIWRRWPNG